MFDFSFAELLVVAGVGLLVLGPQELTVVARKVRTLIRQLKGHMNSLQAQVNEILDEVPSQTIFIKGDDGNFYPSYDMSEIIKPTIIADDGLTKAKQL